MNSKFIGLIILVLVSSSLAADKAYMNAFITKTQQTIIAKNAFIRLANDLTNFSEKVVKTDLKNGETVYKIVNVSGVFGKYNTNSDDSNVVVEYSLNEAKDQLSMKYTLAAATITSEVILVVQVGDDAEKQFTFKTNINNEAFSISSLYTKENCGATVKQATPSNWVSSGSDCANKKSGIEAEACATIMASFTSNNIAALQAFTLENLTTEIKAYEPYAADNSGDIASRQNAATIMQFNTKCVSIPKIITSGDFSGLIYKLDGRPHIKGKDDEALTTTSAEFENFFFNIQYNYQVAIPQYIIDKAYSLLFPNNVEFEWNSVTNLTIDELRKAFPELTREYSRTQLFRIKQTNTKLTVAENKRPVFEGTLKIIFPDELTISIDYTYSPDIITLGSILDSLTLKRTLLFAIINTNAFVSGISVSANSGVVDEYELRAWLIDVLLVIYDQPEFKNPIANGVDASSIFPNYLSHFYYQNNYIFDLQIEKIDTKTTNGVEEIKELLFLRN